MIPIITTYPFFLLKIFFIWYFIFPILLLPLSFPSLLLSYFSFLSFFLFFCIDTLLFSVSLYFCPLLFLFYHKGRYFMIFLPFPFFFLSFFPFDYFFDYFSIVVGFSLSIYLSFILLLGCTYNDRVTFTSECPNISLNVLGSIPISIHLVANVCLNA